MKQITLILSFLIFSLTASFAQGSPGYKPALKKMLEVAGTEAVFKTMITQMISMLKEQKSGVPAEVWDDFETEFSKTSINDLVDLMMPIYQKHLTEADLHQIVAFYETPVGKKLTSKNPLIMQESMQAGQQWGQQIGLKLQEKIKAKGY